MRTNDAKLDMPTLRALVAIQPKGRAELARATGIALPNLSNYLKSGQETLLSKELRNRLFQQMGLSTSGLLKAGCHVWRTEQVEDAVTACKWVVPEAVPVSISELRSEEARLDSSDALVQLYMLRWMEARPRRVLLQLQASEQLAVDARQRLIESGVFAVKEESIDVVSVTPEEYDSLSEIETIAPREFDDLFDRHSELTWDAVIKMLPTLFASAGDAYETLQSIAASREISRVARRVRGKKSE